MTNEEQKTRPPEKGDIQNIKDYEMQCEDFILKFRDYHEKRYIEAQKITMDFSKIIVTNLIWINAAGIGSIPAIIPLLKDNLELPESKFAFALWPGVAFTAGLMFAILGAFLIYLNFSFIARSYDADKIYETNKIRAYLFSNIANESILQAIQGRMNDGINQGSKSRYWLNVFLYLSVASGLISFSIFLSGFWIIISQISNLLH